MNFRAIEVFKPYTDEFPEDLLIAQQCDQADVWRDAEILRIAKKGEEIQGVYAMNRVDATTFDLLGIVVSPTVAKQGLGRWLTGHAIGVAESKGGRLVTLAHAGGTRMFFHIGFTRTDQGWHYQLIPE